MTSLSKLFALAVVAQLAAACGSGQPPRTDPSRSEPALASAPAPELVARRCQENALRHRMVVRCPGLVPAAGVGSRPGKLRVEGRGDFGAGSCSWLAGFQYPRPPGREPDAVFHLLIGGRCDPFPLTTRNGRWPASVDEIEPSLRLVGSGSLSVGDPAGTRYPRVRPKVVARTTVGGSPALVLAFAPYPESGTIHGGHQAIVFNRGGDGQTVSMHFARGSQTQRVELLRKVAASMGTRTN